MFKDFIFWLITSALGGSAVVFLQEFVVGRARRRNARNNEKVDKAISHINKLGELTQLFRNYGHYHRVLLSDETGNLITDEAGQGLIVDSHIMLPDPKWLEEFEKLENKNLDSVIFSLKHKLSIEVGEINDILKELEGSGNLSQEVARYRESVFRLESLINQRQKINNYDDQVKIYVLFMRQLEKATIGRQLIREKVEKLHK